MGARSGRARGALAPPPLNLKKVTSHAAVLQNTLKFLLAPSTLAIDTVYFSLKRREKRNVFCLRLRRAEKCSIFVRRAKNVSTF